MADNVEKNPYEILREDLLKVLRAEAEPMAEADLQSLADTLLLMGDELLRDDETPSTDWLSTAALADVLSHPKNARFLQPFMWNLLKMNVYSLAQLHNTLQECLPNDPIRARVFAYVAAAAWVLHQRIFMLAIPTSELDESNHTETRLARAKTHREDALKLPSSQGLLESSQHVWEQETLSMGAVTPQVSKLKNLGQEPKDAADSIETRMDTFLASYGYTRTHENDLRNLLRPVQQIAKRCTVIVNNFLSCGKTVQPVFQLKTHSMEDLSRKSKRIDVLRERGVVGTYTRYFKKARSLVAVLLREKDHYYNVFLNRIAKTSTDFDLELKSVRNGFRVFKDLEDCFAPIPLKFKDKKGFHVKRVHNDFAKDLDPNIDIQDTVLANTGDDQDMYNFLERLLYTKVVKKERPTI